MDLRIAAVTQDSLHLLDHIAEEVFDSPPDPAHLAAYVADPAQCLLVALREGRVVGQLKAVVHRHPDKAPGLFIEELGIGRAHRRLGVGRRLMQAALDHARHLGCAEVWLATEPENMAANAFYKAAGLDGQHVVMYSRRL